MCLIIRALATASYSYPTCILERDLPYKVRGFPHSSVSKESACNAGDLGSIPGSGRSPGEGNGNPFHYSCLENPMDRRAWQATVHGVTTVGHDLVTEQIQTDRKKSETTSICKWYPLCRISQRSQEKLLKIINRFSEVAEDKINIHTNRLCFYIPAMNIPEGN